MSVATNLAQVRERIAAACARVDRDPTGVRIVAVSKTHPAAAVAEAVAAGADAIGENRVQEAAGKRPLVAAPTPWHLVGPLQRNKAKLALALFDLVETVDRPDLADRLEALLATDVQSRILPVFIEVNIGGETTKSGVRPTDVSALADHLRDRCPHLRLEGLMTVPPYDANPQRSRPHFAALRRLAATVAPLLDRTGFELSMGMSQDFEVAVEEGATWVRLGRVLFGPRHASL
jgi:pyridoxal phosphate enzyme (YggS family)